MKGFLRLNDPLQTTDSDGIFFALGLVSGRKADMIKASALGNFEVPTEKAIHFEQHRVEFFAWLLHFLMVEVNGCLNVPISFFIHEKLLNQFCLAFIIFFRASKIAKNKLDHVNLLYVILILASS